MLCLNCCLLSFFPAEDCAPYETPDVVPIAVGCALIALILIVLVAYLIGRRRNQARGYLSMWVILNTTRLTKKVTELNMFSSNFFGIFFVRILSCFFIKTMLCDFFIQKGGIQMLFLLCSMWYCVFKVVFVPIRH